MSKQHCRMLQCRMLLRNFNAKLVRHCCLFGNKVERCFDNVASTLLLVWTGLNTPRRHNLTHQGAAHSGGPVVLRPLRRLWGLSGDLGDLATQHSEWPKLKHTISVNIQQLNELCKKIIWWRSTVVERRSLAGELSLSCARPAADGWPLMWVNH